MERYGDFQPTQFDPKGLALDDQQDWLVAPVARNRDSGPLSESNFESCLKALGGEGDDVEVHRFGHWANGWFEIIIVRPNSKAASIAADIEAGLEDYPVIDDEDHSRREWEEYLESWSNYGCRDFCKAVLGRHSLCEQAEDAFRDLDSDVLRKLHEDNADSLYEFDSDGCNIRVHASAAKITEDMVIDVLESNGYTGRFYDPVAEQDFNGKWWVDVDGNDFNANRISHIGGVLFCDGVESPNILGPFDDERSALQSAEGVTA